METEITLSPGELELCGIQKIAEMDLGFEVYENYSDKNLIQYNLKTAASDYDYSGESIQNTLQDPDFIKSRNNWNVDYFSNQIDFDAADMKVLSAAVVTEKETQHLYIEVENRSDDVRYFRFDSLGINGLIYGRGGERHRGGFHFQALFRHRSPGGRHSFPQPGADAPCPEDLPEPPLYRHAGSDRRRRPLPPAG